LTVYFSFVLFTAAQVYVEVHTTSLV